MQERIIKSPDLYRKNLFLINRREFKQYFTPEIAIFSSRIHLIVYFIKEVRSLFRTYGHDPNLYIQPDL
ncbi:hypothetical protein SAMN05444412_105208 [Rhodonellum ikkaensis]|uniref:Uncharacterized protein n=1 Tax=Rhodonellum ikkaensis TaxID=336829 RepID=A0A1H3Q436_9BACT|nr:hypothetical protein SAMN05444412_105208 [Rhodonellum ikkaensis]